MIQSIKQDNVLDYGQKMPYCITDHPRFKKIAHVIIRKREFDKTTALKIRRFVEDNKRV